MRNVGSWCFGTVALTLLLLSSPGPLAAEGNPSADGLQALVDEIQTMSEQSALGDSAAAFADARDEATAAIQAGRLHLALDRLVALLEFGPGLIYRAEMAEKIKDQAAFQAEWRKHVTLASEESRNKASASCPGAPAHVRALAERAQNRAAHYYDAALAMAQATEPENGLFYLGRSMAQFDLPRICELLATGGSLELPPVRVLAGEPQALELRTAEEYAKPGAGTEKHGAFIALNAAIKEVLELNEAGLYHGALYQYLDATTRVAMLSAESPGDREDLLNLVDKAAALTRRFTEDGVDHGIVLAFLQRALTELEDAEPEPEGLTRALVIVEEVVPAYAAVVGTIPKAPQPPVAADQVAITLVRWPYT